jgi:ribosome modulation factor
MTADTLGKDLLQALVAELKLLPDVWVKIPKKKQDDIIDRLRNRVADRVKMAVHLLSSQGRTTVVGNLEQITIKDGAKAVIKISKSAESLHQLYDAAGLDVIVVVANAADHTGGMDEIKGEADQRGLDLGHEYHDNDGGGMEGEVVDAEYVPVLELPDPKNIPPSDEELKAAYTEGRNAATNGQPKTDCPDLRHELVKEWLRGWNSVNGRDGGGEE